MSARQIGFNAVPAPGAGGTPLPDGILDALLRHNGTEWAVASRLSLSAAGALYTPGNTLVSISALNNNDSLAYGGEQNLLVGNTSVAALVNSGVQVGLSFYSLVAASTGSSSFLVSNSLYTAVLAVKGGLAFGAQYCMMAATDNGTLIGNSGQQINTCLLAASKGSSIAGNNSYTQEQSCLLSSLNSAITTEGDSTATFGQNTLLGSDASQIINSSNTLLAASNNSRARFSVYASILSSDGIDLQNGLFRSSFLSCTALSPDGLVTISQQVFLAIGSYTAATSRPVPIEQNTATVEHSRVLGADRREQRLIRLTGTSALVQLGEHDRVVYFISSDMPQSTAIDFRLPGYPFVGGDNVKQGHLLRIVNTDRNKSLRIDAGANNRIRLSNNYIGTVAHLWQGMGTPNTAPYIELQAVPGTEFGLPAGTIVWMVCGHDNVYNVPASYVV